MNNQRNFSKGDKMHFIVFSNILTDDYFGIIYSKKYKDVEETEKIAIHKYFDKKFCLNH